MKIIKEECIETWFSPKRFMKEINSIELSTYNIIYYVLINNNKICHRQNAPAITSLDGNKAYFYKGKYHRNNGRDLDNLVMEQGWSKQWYFYGINFNEEKYWNC